MSDTQEKLEEILDNLGERYIMVEHRLIHQGMPESNGKHKELEHAKTKISHLIESAKREGAIEELEKIFDYPILQSSGGLTVGQQRLKDMLGDRIKKLKELE